MNLFVINLYRSLAVTNFHRGNAKLLFPCFNDPKLRSDFKIKVYSNPEFETLSNMPVRSLSDG